jgi:hypothetical protein
MLYMKILLMDNGYTPPKGTWCHVPQCFQPVKGGVDIIEIGAAEEGRQPVVGGTVLCAQHIFDLMTGADVEVETRPGDRAGTAELWLVPTVSEASGTLAAPTSEGEHDAEVKC